jgi:hypothetical protein
VTLNGIVRDQTYKQEVARSSRAPPIVAIPRSSAESRPGDG